MIRLPDAMKRWVEARAEDGRYSNASDYVRDLIRRDQERTVRLAALQRLIDDGMASGVAEGFSMEEIQAELDAF